MSILVRREKEKYFFRLKTAVNYGPVKCQAGAEVSRFEVSYVEGFFFRSLHMYRCNIIWRGYNGEYETPKRSIMVGKFDN